MALNLLPAPFSSSIVLARAIFAAAIAAAFAIPASGDVMDIASSGAVTVYKSPGIFSDDGVQPFQFEPSVRSPRRSFSAPTGHVESMISLAAARYEIDAPLLKSLAWQESRFHHEAVSPKGAVGVMQLMAATARDLGVDRYDLSQNILGGAAYLRQMLDRYGGDRSLALAAYNAGPAAVDRYRGIPPFLETKTYVNSIMGLGAPGDQTSQPFVIFINR